VRRRPVLPAGRRCTLPRPDPQAFGLSPTDLNTKTALVRNLLEGPKEALASVQRPATLRLGCGPAILVSLPAQPIPGPVILPYRM